MYRVLFLIHVIDNQLIEQLHALLKANPEMEIVVAPRDGVDEAQWARSEIGSVSKRIRLCKPYIRNLPWGRAWYVWQLLRICLVNRVSLVDTHMGLSLESRVTYLIHRLTGLPYIVSLYGKERDYLQPAALTAKERRWLERVLHSAKLLICHDKTLMETAEAIVRDRVPKVLLYNATNLERTQGDFDREPIRQKLGVSRGRKVVLYNHRIIPFKRPLVYVQAMQMIKAHCPEVCFLFVGPQHVDTELGREMQSQIDNLGLRQDVVWIDRRISGYEMDEAYAITDVAINIAELVVPSLSTLEAMSFGIPLVITDELDSELYVRHGENGFLVPAEPRAVADAAIRIISNEELRRRMSEAGRTRAARYFDIEDWGRRIVQCYRHVLFRELLPSAQSFR